jgi:hypothetical protein
MREKNGTYPLIREIDEAVDIRTAVPERELSDRILSKFMRFHGFRKEDEHYN